MLIYVLFNEVFYLKNKEIKKTLINNGTFKEYREQRFSMFENKQYDLVNENKNYFHNETGEQFTQLECECCLELKEARKKQIHKIREHILYWLNNDYYIYFGTFTYSDDKVKKSIKPETLKKYIINTITNICDDYIINIDYGKDNERLHYHLLYAIKKNNFNNDFYLTDEKRNKGSKDKPIWVKGKKLNHKKLLDYENKIGWYDLEPCKDDEESAKKLSRYIDKLTLHSLKVKQSYVSVKKGTDYQKQKQFKKVLKDTIKNENMIKSSYFKVKDIITINNNKYLQVLRNNKNLLNTNQFCETEYKLLNENRVLIENQQKHIDKVKQEKAQNSKLFDINIDLEEIKKHAKYYKSHI